MSTRDDRAPGASITLHRRADRATDELVGLCRGLLADGHVSQNEAEFLKGWIERNSQFVGTYPFDRIYRLLSDVLRDGVIDQDESADLHDTLIRFVGGEAYSPEAQTASLATTLPVNDPQPRVVHPGAIFVVTGTFAFGRRPEVVQAIEQRGGSVGGAPSRRTNYVVIGELGSRDWLHSNAGTKILKAVELRDAGHPVAIVSELHWASALR